MTRSLVRAARSPWSATSLALLALLASSARPQDPAPEEHAAPPHAAAAAALRPGDGEPELAYSCALARARRGDLTGAIGALAALADRTLQDDLALHVARDLERIRLFQALRARHLDELVATGGTLRLQLEGRRLTFTVESVEEDRVVFRNSAFGVHSLPFSRLDSLQVAKQIPRDLDGPTGRWVRLYPYMLVDVERGRQLLRRDCRGLDEVSTLVDDAEQWYPQSLLLVNVAASLEELVRGASTGAPADRTLERIQRLLAVHGTLEPVQRRLPQLRSLAAACLEGSFEVGDVLAQLHGRQQRLEDGSLRLAYDFDEREELEDFRRTTGYPPERIRALPALEVHAAKGLFELREGQLVVAGSTCLRHVLPFQGAIVVRCRVRVEAAPAGGSPSCFWMIGACDDGHERYVALQELGTAMAVDPARAFVAYAAAEPSRRLSLDVPYELELQCDGETVRTRVDGRPVREVPAAGLCSGEVFFVVHSDAPVVFDRIEIDVAPGGLGEGAPWISARLSELGFPASTDESPEVGSGVQ